MLECILLLLLLLDAIYSLWSLILVGAAAPVSLWISDSGQYGVKSVETGTTSKIFSKYKKSFVRNEITGVAVKCSLLFFLYLSRKVESCPILILWLRLFHTPFIHMVLDVILKWHECGPSFHCTYMAVQCWDKYCLATNVLLIHHVSMM